MEELGVSGMCPLVNQWRLPKDLATVECSGTGSGIRITWFQYCLSHQLLSKPPGLVFSVIKWGFGTG